MGERVQDVRIDVRVIDQKCQPCDAVVSPLQTSMAEPATRLDEALLDPRDDVATAWTDLATRQDGL